MFILQVTRNGGKMFEIGVIKTMKQMIVIGILTVLSLTILSACGTTTEANPSQEALGIISDVMDAEYEEETIHPLLPMKEFTERKKCW